MRIEFERPSFEGSIDVPLRAGFWVKKRVLIKVPLRVGFRL